MAHDKPDTTARPCAAAALADEARQLIDAHIAIDASIRPSGEDYIAKARQESLLEVTAGYLDAAMRRASYVNAKTAHGALFQICAISHHMLELDNRITSEIDARIPEASKAITRLLYSIAGFIEEATGASLDHACGDWFLCKDASEPARLTEALAFPRMSEAPEKAGCDGVLIAHLKEAAN